MRNVIVGVAIAGAIALGFSWHNAKKRQEAAAILLNKARTFNKYNRPIKTPGNTPVRRNKAGIIGGVETTII